MRGLLRAVSAAALTFGVSFAIVSPADAEVATHTPWTWDTCQPMVWSYDSTTTPDDRPLGRTAKALATAMRQVSAMTGIPSHPATSGETVNVTVSWGPLVNQQSQAEALPRLDTTGTRTEAGDVRLDPAWMPRKRGEQRAVLVHELGHVLGLNHTTPSSGDVMSTFNWPVVKQPTADDRLAFAALNTPCTGN